jgi:hypothetical protein
MDTAQLSITDIILDIPNSWTKELGEYRSYYCLTKTPQIYNHSVTM